MTFRETDEGQWWWDGNGWVFVEPGPEDQVQPLGDLIAAGLAVRRRILGSIASSVRRFRRHRPARFRVRCPLVHLLTAPCWTPADAAGPAEDGHR
jgi:hypothetical protein